MQNDEFSKRLSNGKHATAGVTIQRRADELYAVWRELADLPRFIDDLERIEKLDERRSRWTVRGPAGREYSWEARIINEEPGRVLAWRTDEDADVPHAGSVTFREMIKCVRRAGTISVLGVYSGMVDSLPFGVAFNKSVTVRMGQVRVQAFHRMLLDLIMDGRIDPSEIITHRMGLDDAAEAYRMFDEKRDRCLKVVLRPGMSASAAGSSDRGPARGA